MPRQNKSELIRSFNNAHLETMRNSAGNQLEILQDGVYEDKVTKFLQNSKNSSEIDSIYERIITANPSSTLVRSNIRSSVSEYAPVLSSLRSVPKNRYIQTTKILDQQRELRKASREREISKISQMPSANLRGRSLP